MKKPVESPTASEIAALSEIIGKLIERGVLPPIIKSAVATLVRARRASKPAPRRGDIWRNQSVAKGDLEILAIHRSSKGSTLVICRNVETDRVSTSRLDVFLRIHSMVRRRTAFEGGDDVVGEVTVADESNVRRLLATVRRAPEGA